MGTIRLAENIARLRREKGVTQEEVAAFLNVTKASVSKWENGQSMPDLLLLPQIATYFSVTVDALLGYEPQLSREQIQRLYQELAEEMARRPFEEVFEKSERLVKQYYSCYPFLYQMCVLWLNHFVLAEKEERRATLLEKISALCGHIIKHSPDAGLCSDAMVMDALVRLQAGKPAEAIERLEALLNPYRQLRQGDGILIQAYCAAGEAEKAGSHAQITMYIQLLSLVGTAMQYLDLHSQETEICEETIRRVSAVLDAYRVEELQPNQAASFYYHAALAKAVQGQTEEALSFLERYVRLVLFIVRENSFLHGDAYFTELDGWFEATDQGTQLLRDKSLILKGTEESLRHPAFEALTAQERFTGLKETLEAAFTDFSQKN